MKPSFIHLHLHTEYSLRDGLVRLKPLVKAVAAAGMPAVAVTDVVNLFGLVKFYKAAFNAGIKPIAGAEILVRNPKDPKQPHQLILLIQNEIGYRNLTSLISQAYLKGQKFELPQVEIAWIIEKNEGLLALSGGMRGDVAQSLQRGQRKQAILLLDNWLQVFGERYYLELTRTKRTGEETLIIASVELAIQKGVPVVATNDVRFLTTEDFDAHEARVCIHAGYVLNDPQRLREYSPEQYLRTSDEMLALFEDLPEALENTVEIAKLCNLELKFGKNVLPDFPVPQGTTLEQFFTQRARHGLTNRLIELNNLEPDHRDEQKYNQRLELELQVILQMGFAGYFLIVADFIQWAKDQKIPVGPGRGSGAGSLVAYALKITDLDPLEHDLLFERFLNPERVSLPDFDIDFCMDGRDRVIDYVAEQYGREAVSQIITFGTLAAKMVVRDVGRILGHPYGFVEKISKMVPFELGMTLEKALNDSNELKRSYNEDEEIHAIIELALKLEGLVRNPGKHAGGLVIAPTKLTDFTALYCDPDGTNIVTQFDKDDIEAIGLIKFDFLGLRTLTIIDWTLQTINTERAAQGLNPLSIDQIDPKDAKAFEMLKSGETTAVFQLESHGMKDLIKKLQPDSFADMTALVALFRPGPLQSGMVDDFIKRKHGDAEIIYPHPELEPILRPTYGIILYQEQVMQIAQVLAGYSLGEADLLRRAMGKKKKEEMDQQRAIFEQGASLNNVEPSIASYIFDLMDKFAGYGFNKSHSAAYALVSYQTLWLKAHYPAAFMAAVLTADLDHTDKIVSLLDACRGLGLSIKPPAINASQYRFTVSEQNTILYGLGAIKGVGAAVIDMILEVRKQTGNFRDLWDFCQRIDLQKINRRVFESLIRSGALDDFGANRGVLLNQLPLALKLAERNHLVQMIGQQDLFGGISAEIKVPVIDPKFNNEDASTWDDEQRLQGEKDTLGFYLTGHPLERYQTELHDLKISKISELLKHAPPVSVVENFKYSEQESVHLVGLVLEVRHRKSKKGQIASLILEDQSARIEVTIFSTLYVKILNLLIVDNILSITGILRFDKFRDAWTLRADNICSFEELRATRAKHLVLTLDFSNPQIHINDENNQVHELEKLLRPFCSGSLPIYINYIRPGAMGKLILGQAWCVQPTDELLKKLRKLLGLESVKIIYEHANY